MKKRVTAITAIGIFLLISVVAYGATIFVSDDPALLYNSVGNYHYKLGNVEKANSMYEKALAIDPNNVKAHYNIGVVYYAQGNHNAAKEKFEQTLSLDNNNERAHNSLGLLLFEQGDYDNSIKHLEQVLFLNPNNINAEFDLAVVYVEKFRQKEKSGNLVVEDLEDLRSGLAHYSAVVDKKPDFPDAQSNRDIVSSVLAMYEAQI